MSGNFARRPYGLPNLARPGPLGHRTLENSTSSPSHRKAAENRLRARPRRKDIPSMTAPYRLPRQTVGENRLHAPGHLCIYPSHDGGRTALPAARTL
jgi:hypothetical protein